ncbi:hypothetical protein FPQ18DRAFT_310001 [Pyronema domesticum]|nr:hypothetical protein FPQ18DRAFT_310001 [Pyronema domesticum]
MFSNFPNDHLQAVRAISNEAERSAFIEKMAKVFESKLSDAQKTDISSSPPGSQFHQMAQQHRISPVAAFARNQAIHYYKKMVENLQSQTAQNTQNLGMKQQQQGQNMTAFEQAMMQQAMVQAQARPQTRDQADIERREISQQQQIAKGLAVNEHVRKFSQTSNSPQPPQATMAREKIEAILRQRTPQLTGPAGESANADAQVIHAQVILDHQEPADVNDEVVLS